MSGYTQVSAHDEIDLSDKESLCSSTESTPTQVRRRISDVKQTKEKYVNKAKSTISAGKNSTTYFMRILIV